MIHIQDFSTFKPIQESVWPKSKSVPKRGTPDYHEHKIAVDTVKNPNKGMFMDGPSVEEDQETPKSNYVYSSAVINKLGK